MKVGDIVVSQQKLWGPRSGYSNRMFEPGTFFTVLEVSQAFKEGVHLKLLTEESTVTTINFLYASNSTIYLKVIT